MASATDRRILCWNCTPYKIWAFNLGYTLQVLKPLQGDSELRLEGKPAMAVCIHDNSAPLGEPGLVCEMLTLTRKLGRGELALSGMWMLLKAARTSEERLSDSDATRGSNRPKVPELAT